MPHHGRKATSSLSRPTSSRSTEPAARSFTSAKAADSCVRCDSSATSIREDAPASACTNDSQLAFRRSWGKHTVDIFETRFGQEQELGGSPEVGACKRNIKLQKVVS